MKTQKISTEFSTPRFRALSYYLEKEGKTIEGELQKKLEELYRDQVPKDVQEYVKAQHPDEVQEAEQPDGKGVKRQRPGQKQEPGTSGSAGPTLKM